MESSGLDIDGEIVVQGRKVGEMQVHLDISEAA